MVSEGLVKFSQLINSLISNQSFTNKQNQVRLVYLNKLEKRKLKP